MHTLITQAGRQQTNRPSVSSLFVENNVSKRFMGVAATVPCEDMKTFLKSPQHLRWKNKRVEPPKGKWQKMAKNKIHPRRLKPKIGVIKSMQDFQIMSRNRSKARRNVIWWCHDATPQLRGLGGGGGGCRGEITAEDGGGRIDFLLINDRRTGLTHGPRPSPKPPAFPRTRARAWFWCRITEWIH